MKSYSKPLSQIKHRLPKPVQRALRSLKITDYEISLRFLPRRQLVALCRFLREREGLTQQAIANTTGLNQSTVSKYLSRFMQKHTKLTGAIRGVDGKSYPMTRNRRGPR